MEDLGDFDTDPAATNSRSTFDRPERDFEHRRIHASVHLRLFDEGSELCIGRFRVMRRIGAGGMGEVYLCHDDELGRKVAIKRLIGLGDPHERQRLRREARALARLSHPNVVQIYELGMHEGCPFLVMEYVDGQTLDAWLQTKRPRRLIVEHFLAAGRGLAAAHGAGIVHRDFKPENVLIGEGGTTRVVDFGVALALREAPERAPPVASSLEQLERRLTASVAGTIRFMPLEQLLGGEVDARSDQFAFCVAFYEAVWGVAPFPLTNLRTRVEALEHDRPLEPPGTRALWRLLRRGLEREPADRWPDMQALLDALARGPTRRRRSLLVSALAASLVSGLLLAGRSPDPCASLELELEGIWDAEQRAKLEALAAAHGEDSKQRIFAHLDDWRRRWLEHRGQLCQARVAAGPGLPLHLELRDACLMRQRQHAQHLVALVASSDANTLADAVHAAAELPQPERCAELHLLEVEPPSPAIADQVEALRSEFARVRTLRTAGQLSDALALAKANDEAAQAIGYGPLDAEARAERARTEFEAGVRKRSVALYDAAIVLAGTHRHTWLRAELLVERASLALHEPGDADAGRAWLRQAESSRQQLGIEDPRFLAKLSFARGRIFELEGKLSQAEIEYRAAIQLLENTPHTELPTYLDALSRVVDGETLELKRAALDFARERYGPHRPRTARWLYNYGIEAKRRGLPGAELELAVEIWTTNGHSPHRLAKALVVLADEALAGRRFDAARDYADALIELNAHLLAPDHPDHGEPFEILAKIEGSRGNHDAALEHARAAIAAFERGGGKREHDPRALSMRIEVGNQLLSRARLDEADAAFAAVLAHPRAPNEFELDARLGLVEVAVRRGELERASVELEHIETLDPGTPEASRLIHALLSALVSYRQGRASRAQLEASAAMWASQTSFSDSQLLAWLEELELRADETRALGLRR